MQQPSMRKHVKKFRKAYDENASQMYLIATVL